jgi:hypothetical protein
MGASVSVKISPKENTNFSNKFDNFFIGAKTGAKYVYESLVDEMHDTSEASRKRVDGVEIFVTEVILSKTIVMAHF